MSIHSKQLRPIARLQQLIEVKRAHFPVGKGIRAGLSIGLTFALGLWSGHAMEGVFVCIAALCFSAGEASNMTYRAMFRQTLIATVIGGLGAFAGLVVGLPWYVTIVLMTLLAFACAIISNFGMPYSVGTMIGLVLATVVVGMPVRDMGWKLFICFQIGTAFYLFLLSCEALIDSRLPERQLLSKHIKMLADYARTKSEQLPQADRDTSALQRSLDNALDSYFDLYSALLNSTRRNSAERAQETDGQAAILQALDSVLSHLIAVDHNAALLGRSAAWLDSIADAIAHKSKTPPPRPPHDAKVDTLSYSIVRLSANVWSSSPVPARLASPRQAPAQAAFKEKVHMGLRRLIVGKEATIVALIFAACMGTAFATKYFITANHWYWVPLTVALTMKPDFGSVFSRAIARSVGTVLGAIVGTILLFVLPKGLALIIAMGVLAMLLPWAKMISYATQVTAITAILLVLLDLVSPSPITVNYAGQRVGDTILASLIILFFSYMVWPRNKHEEIGNKFNVILSAIADYLKVACQSTEGSAQFDAVKKEVFRRKLAAYQNLSDLRLLLHRMVVEPAPIGTEATSWLPLVSGAERLCDKINVYFTQRAPDSATPNAHDIEYLAYKIGAIVENHSGQTPHTFSSQNTDDLNRFLFDINDEINSLSKLLQKNVHAEQPASMEGLTARSGLASASLRRH